MIILALASLAFSPQGTPPPAFTTITIGPKAPNDPLYPVKHLSPADLNDNVVVDFVHQTADHAYAAIDASVNDAAVFAPLGSRAVTAMPGEQGLYATNDVGLVFAQPSSMPWEWATPSIVVSGGDWAGAVSLEVFDVDGLGGPDLLGVSADRHGILMAVDSGAGMQGSSQALAITVGEIDDVIAYRYDFNRAAMIVASTSIGLESFWLSGGAVSTVNRPTPNGKLAVLHDVDDPDRFAWLRDNPTGRRLEIFDLPGTPASALLLPGYLSTMASGNYDNDRIDDLIFGGTPLEDGAYPVRVKILRQTSMGTFTLQGDDARDFEFESFGGDLEYEPYLGDADGDGDGDVVVAAPDGTLYLALSDSANLDLVAPYFLNTAYGEGAPLDHLWMPHTVSNDTSFELNARLDASQAVPEILEDGVSTPATHIEWIIWSTGHVGDIGEPDYLTDSTMLAQGFIELDTDKVDDHPMLPGISFYHLSHVIFDASSFGTGVRYLTMRYAAFGGDPYEAVYRWPARQYYLVSGTNQTGADYMMQFALPGLVENLPQDDPADGVDPPGATEGGGSTSCGPTGCCRDFGNDCPPGDGGTPPPPAGD